MNAKSITSALIVAALGFTLGMPGSALADRDDRGHRHDHSQHYGHKHRHHRHERKHHKRHHKHHKRQHKHHKHHAKRHYKHRKKHYHGRHGHGGYRNYYYYKNKDNDDDDHEKLLIGLVIGGILGYALNEHQQGSVEQYGDYYQRNAYQPNSSSSCLQEREYQTTVIVGGRPVDAYGTACLQPDGSWTRSHAQVTSY